MDEKTIASRIAQNRDFMKSSFGREAVVSDQRSCCPSRPWSRRPRGASRSP